MEQLNLSNSVTRWLSFAGSTVAVEYSSPQAAQIIDFLYQNIQANEQIAPHATYRLVCESKEPLDNNPKAQFTLYRDETLVYEGDSEAVLAERFVGDTIYHLVDQSQGGLLFHAAALSWQGHGILLPASSGSGKTTLTAWLLTKGLSYLTDEVVFIPHHTSTMQTFTRPLNLKRSARPVLHAIFDFDSHAADILSSDYADIVPSTLLGQANPLSEPAVKLIIFPLYQADSDFVLQPLSKAQVGLELMQYLVNARNLPEHGFPEIARLARTVPAYKMRYGSFQQVETHLQSLLNLTTFPLR